MNMLNRIKRLKKQLTYKKNNDDFVCDENDRAIINVGAENYDDIFSAYCYKGGDTLASNLVEYLNQKANAVPLDYDLTIRFHVKNASEEKRLDIQSAVKENYVNDIRGLEKRMYRTTIFSMWFILIGIMFMIAYLFTLELVPVAVSYVSDIFAWLFLWEGMDAFFLDRRILKLDNLKAYRLATAKIEIVEFEVY